MQKIKIIKSRNPFFSAWKTFNWDQNTWGAVASLSVLKKSAELGETIRFKFRGVKEVFEIDAKEAYDFVTKNNAHTIVQVPQKAGVIPTSIMKKVYVKDNSSNNNVQSS